MKDQHKKPLFIALVTRYFNAFADGSKTHEYRLYGGRWNEKTCRVGRAVTLSRGYGKQARLPGTVSSFRRLSLSQLPPHVAASMLELYGARLGGHDIAEIGIEVA